MILQMSQKMVAVPGPSKLVNPDLEQVCQQIFQFFILFLEVKRL